jgi:4-hydroxyphenylpyruvate dioxygenase
VADAAEAYHVSTANGAVGLLPPTTLKDDATNTCSMVSEIRAYGDVIIRWVSGDYAGPFLPTYTAMNSPALSYGLGRIDHVTVNVPNLPESVDYLHTVTGAPSHLFNLSCAL